MLKELYAEVLKDPNIEETKEGIKQLMEDTKHFSHPSGLVEPQIRIMFEK